MATTTMNQGTMNTPLAPGVEANPRVETPRSEQAKLQSGAAVKPATPMSQESINRILSWVAALALIIAIAAVVMATKANRASSDAMTTLMNKADKSEVPNYGEKPALPSDMASNPAMNAAAATAGGQATGAGAAGNTQTGMGASATTRTNPNAIGAPGTTSPGAAAPNSDTNGSYDNNNGINSDANGGYQNNNGPNNNGQNMNNLPNNGYQQNGTGNVRGGTSGTSGQQ